MMGQSDPMARLRESVRWFVGVPELRVLHVHVASELRLGALMEIAKGEERYTNRSLFLLSDVPAELGAPEWDQRKQQVDALMAERRAQAAEHAVVIAEAVGEQALSGLEGFATALRRHVDALPSSLVGIVLVLAPSPLVDASGWANDLRLLLQAPLLHRLRYIVVEEDPAPGRAVARELGEQAELVDVQPGPSANRQLLALRLAGMKSAPKGADPARLVGMAGPREPPPPRPRVAMAEPTTAAHELEAAGAPPALANQEAMQALRIELTSAALAQDVGDTKAVIQHQTQARDQALRAGLVDQAAMLDLMLGAHMLQGGSSAAAIRHFDRVIDNMRNAEQPKIEAQAHMAKGAALMVEQKPHEAGSAYLAGAAAAEKADSKALAIECYRMMGHIWLTQGNEAEAAHALGRAIAVAQAGTQEEKLGSSAPQAARQLASLYRRQRLIRQAEALEAEADRWEAEGLATAQAIEAGANGSSPPGSSDGGPRTSGTSAPNGSGGA